MKRKNERSKKDQKKKLKYTHDKSEGKSHLELL
jgi:hypothetical protein